MSTLATRFPALSSRDFRIFWIGQFVSLIGTWMQTITQPYLAYRISGQPFYLGLIGFANTLPALFLTLPGGVMVERMDKRKVVIVMQSIMMLQAFVLSFLALTGQVTIWHIIALSFILGAANSIEITARQAMMIELVGREALPNAIALNSSIFNAARVLGPAAAAPLLVLFQDRGEGWAFFANGLSYLVVIISLFYVHPRAEYAPARSGDNHAGPIQQFREGQSYIRQTRTVGLLILMAAIPAFIGFPGLQQIPVFARDVLRQLGDTDAIVAARNSALVTAQGVGALIAALTLASFSGIRRKGLLLTVGQFAFAAALLGLAFSQNLLMTLPLMTVIGWGIVTHLAMTNTLIQLIVPNSLRGRVISTYLWAQQGAAPFGSLLIGWLAQTWGAPVAVLFGGAVCMLTAAALHVITPRVRQVAG